MSARVRVEPPGGAAVERDLDGGELVIGRAPDVGLVVPDSRISRRHARLVRRDDACWWVEDLGATNATYLNGHVLQGAASLQPGDRLQLGSTVVVFLGEVPSGAPTGGAVTAASRAEGDDGDRQAARLRTLNDVHRALAQPISLGDLLDLILERCFELLHPEEGVVVLRDATGQLATAASRQRDGGTVTVPRRLIEEVAGKGQPALVLDATMDERFSGSESIVASGIRSIVAAPLSDVDGTLGLIALSSRANVRRFVQADLDLLMSIASAASLRVRNIALVEEAAARRVLDRELALAHDIQMAMLPQHMPIRPEVAVAATLTPARSVGGDLYDVVLEGDRLWFIVADVAGKGVSAALYMAVARTLFHAMAGTGAGLLDVVCRMNRELSRDNDQLVFVTALVGCLNVRSGALTVVDAGHNPAWLTSRDGRVGMPATRKCLALGVDEDAPYMETELDLTAGDMLVVYTDGVTDARSTAGEMFGEARLEQAIRAAAALDEPAQLVATVVGEVNRFAAGAPAEDDITMLAIKFRGE